MYHTAWYSYSQHLVPSHSIDPEASEVPLWKDLKIYLNQNSSNLSPELFPLIRRHQRRSKLENDLITHHHLKLST